MRRSEFVTVPSFSPQAAAGSRIARRKSMVSFERMTSDTTNRSSPRIASRTRSARGSDTAGLVAMTQSALMSPAAIASNIATAFRPSRVAMRGAFQKRRTRSTSGGLEAHMRGEHVREPADFAPAHRVGLAGERERPHAGPADAPRRKWQLTIALTLSVPCAD